MLTAPKALGRDSIDVKLIEDRETLRTILDEAKKFQDKWPFYSRDAKTLEDKDFICFWLTQETRSSEPKLRFV